MNGEKRRAQILQLLQESALPLSGTALAQQLHVSRQVIVQDIALMRAEQHAILSTNKGYLCGRRAEKSSLPKRVVYVQHDARQILEEFMLVLELGGKILDLAVEHEIYGQIRVDLLIETEQAARDFSQKLAQCRDNPLNVLTGGCHYHTIAAPSEKLLDLIQDEFARRGFLVPEEN